MIVNLVTSVPLAPPWDQGDKNQAYQLTRTLPHIRFQVLTNRNGEAPQGANLEFQPVYSAARPSLLQKAAWLLRLAGSPVRRAAQSETDLYHLYFQPTHLAAHLLSRLPLLRRNPVIQTIPAITEIDAIDARLFFGDRVVVVSEYARARLASAGIDTVRHIPTGVVFSEWQALTGQGPALKHSLGFGPGPLILYTGHFEPGYGIETLVAAMPRLVHQFPQVQFALACRSRAAVAGSVERQIRQRLEQLGLAERVKILHTVADMRSLIGASDMVVLPFEKLHGKVDIPTTLIEALAAGKPVVVSDIAPMNELIHLEGARLHPQSVGLAVPVGDACALADGCGQILESERLRAELGERGQCLVQSRFDMRQVGLAYEKLYQELLG